MFVRLFLSLVPSPRFQEKSGRGKMVLIAVEALPAGIWPPAGDGSMRTSTGGRCGFDASAPLSTGASSLRFGGVITEAGQTHRVRINLAG